MLDASEELIQREDQDLHSELRYDRTDPLTAHVMSLMEIDVTDFLRAATLPEIDQVLCWQSFKQLKFASCDHYIYKKLSLERACFLH